MSMFDFGEPALQGWLIVFLTEQQFCGIPSEYILREKIFSDLSQKYKRKERKK